MSNSITKISQLKIKLCGTIKTGKLTEFFQEIQKIINNFVVIGFAIKELDHIYR